MDKVTGIINQSVFVPDVPSQLEKLEGKAVEMKRLSKGRSSKQNRYYFGTVIPTIAKELG